MRQKPFWWEPQCCEIRWGCSALTVLGICLVPFLQLGIHYLAYKLTAALTGTVSAGRVTGLIDSIGGAFGLVLGMTGACALLMLVSIVSAISVVTV